MADRFTYGTGISSQPIDLVSGAERFMQSAVEQKMADIEAERSQISDTSKAMVKAMSLRTIDGLSRGLQEKYQTEIDDYHKKITDMHIAGEGKISKPKQLEIQRGFQDIEQRQLQDISALKQRDTVRKLALDPNAQYAYNLPEMLSELSKWDKAFEKGEFIGDPMTIPFKHQIEASVDDYIYKQYNDAIETLDVEALGDYKGNVFTQTELSGLNVDAAKSIEKVQRLVDTMMDDPNIKRRYTARDGRVFEDERTKVRQSIEDAISQKISKVQKGTTSRAGRGAPQKTLSPKPVELASGKTDTYVDYPASQAEKRFTLNEAFNEETGRTDKFDTAASMRVIGFDVPNNRVFFVSEGGELKKGGEIVYGGAGIVSDDAKRDDKLEEGVTWKSLNENPLMTFAPESKFGKTTNATRVTDVKKKENPDGTITFSGNVEKWRKKKLGVIGGGLVKEVDLDKKNHILEDSETVSITLDPLTDEKAATRYSQPLDQYEEVVSELTQYGVGGQRVWDYYKTKKGTSVSETGGNTRKDGTKKGTGYFGVLKTKDGRDATEMAIGVDFNGKETEIPMLIPTLTEKEKRYLLDTPIEKHFTADKKIFNAIRKKAIAHARNRMKEGKSPFAESGDYKSKNKYGV